MPILVPYTSRMSSLVSVWPQTSYGKVSVKPKPIEAWKPVSSREGDKGKRRQMAAVLTTTPCPSNGYVLCSPPGPCCHVVGGTSGLAMEAVDAQAGQTLHLPTGLLGRVHGGIPLAHSWRKRWSSCGIFQTAGRTRKCTRLFFYISVPRT